MTPESLGNEKNWKGLFWVSLSNTEQCPGCALQHKVTNSLGAPQIQRFFSVPFLPVLTWVSANGRSSCAVPAVLPREVFPLSESSLGWEGLEVRTSENWSDPVQYTAYPILLHSHLRKCSKLREARPRENLGREETTTVARVYRTVSCL